MKPLHALSAVLALVCAPALAQSPRVLGKAGDGVKVEAAGPTIYRNADDQSRNSIEFGCDVAQSLDHSGTGVSIELGGRMLPTNSHVSFIVDGQSITIPSDKMRQQAGAALAAAAAGKSLTVVASNGRRARFSLNGTSKLMPPEFCPGIS
jgi:hypothetical protein